MVEPSNLLLISLPLRLAGWLNDVGIAA